VAWVVAAAVAGLSLTLAFYEKEVPLRESLKTEFGIKEPKKVKDGEAAKPNTERTRLCSR
jgi:hypothetical protein